MKKVTSSRLLKLSAIVSVFALPFVLLSVHAATTASTLNQTINAGTLNIAIVDSDNATVSSPSVTFSAATFSFATQDTTGTLGTTDENIRLDNPTSTAAWNVTLAATGGNSAVWHNSGSTQTYPYNAAAQSDGRLAVDPSVGTITPWGSCSGSNVSKGGADFFVTATPNITLMSASSSADPYCRWYLTGVGMTQTIPAIQPVDSYTLPMTLTAI